MHIYRVHSPLKNFQHIRCNIRSNPSVILHEVVEVLCHLFLPTEDYLRPEKHILEGWQTFFFEPVWHIMSMQLAGFLICFVFLHVQSADSLFCCLPLPCCYNGPLTLSCSFLKGRTRKGKLTKISANSFFLQKDRTMSKGYNRSGYSKL